MRIVFDPPAPGEELLENCVRVAPSGSWYGGMKRPL
jgi:hypothetical protein